MPVQFLVTTSEQRFSFQSQTDKHQNPSTVNFLSKRTKKCNYPFFLFSFPHNYTPRKKITHNFSHLLRAYKQSRTCPFKWMEMSFFLSLSITFSLSSFQTAILSSWKSTTIKFSYLPSIENHRSLYKLKQFSVAA